MANDLDEVKRVSPNLVNADYGALHILSGNQLRESTHKWLSPPDPPRTTTLHVVLISRKQQHGFLKVAHIRSGSRQAHFFGSTAQCELEGLRLQSVFPRAVV
jgi:hypothetical protein